MDGLTLVFRVDPQFVHRTLARQALGINLDLELSRFADAITEELLSREVVDLRVAAVKDELSTVLESIVVVQTAAYFKYHSTGTRERCHFHYKVVVDDSVELSIEGSFDPERFEATSPRDILSGKRRVFISGIATRVDEDPLHVEIRPLLIGIPYFVPHGSGKSPLYRQQHSFMSYIDVDQFRLTQDDFKKLVTRKEAQELFSMSESEVKRLFGYYGGVGNPSNVKGGPP